MLISGKTLEHSQEKESDFVYAWSANLMQRDFKNSHQETWLLECLFPCIIRVPFCWV